MSFCHLPYQSVNFKKKKPLNSSHYYCSMAFPPQVPILHCPWCSTFYNKATINAPRRHQQQQKLEYYSCQDKNKLNLVKFLMVINSTSAHYSPGSSRVYMQLFHNRQLRMIFSHEFLTALLVNCYLPGIGILPALHSTQKSTEACKQSGEDESACQQSIQMKYSSDQSIYITECMK